jgi:ribulose-5-phosphate 4-epimerase/fuculose-1-phosphate aldolase
MMLALCIHFLEEACVRCNTEDGAERQEGPVAAACAEISVKEKEARIELAALYRLLELHFGYQDGIYTHASLRVPGDCGQFLIKRHRLLYREVSASNLIKVPVVGNLDEDSGVNRPGYVLHSGVLAARDDVNCAIHIHTKVGLALSAHKRGLRMMTQNSIRFYDRIGYHHYEGLVVDAQEGARIAGALGPTNIALVLKNHGLVLVGATVRDAFERTRDFLIAAESQLMLEATGAGIDEVPPLLCSAVVKQWEDHDRGRGSSDWPAWRRMLDGIDPSYKS